MPLDEVSQGFLAEMAATRTPPVHEGTPAIARMSGMVFAGLSGRGPDVGEVRNLRLATPDGDTIRVRVIIPEDAPRSVIVYFHGGGWVIGDIDLQYDHLARDLATRTRSTVVLVNYRKAPEHPFPTALEDSWLGLSWAAGNAGDLAVADAPLIVGGDSAGGNIATVLTRWARDRGGPAIGCQVLVYPVTDCDLDRPSYLAPENQLLLGRDTMAWFWGHYLADPSERMSPDASPIRADSLADLPPALVYVAEFDPLHDEGVAYAEALQAAGVPVTLEEAAGQMHAYFQMANIFPGYTTGIELVAQYIGKFLADNGRGA
ncbi:acetyl esterase [Williamsia limnetica]|uniref:Acetyl esterase n=1 Tax=Williamsia limnetica TaxID=882452 RepID=A0A318RKE9_WILLI|nr:alpha/beta hydrolase [Williamsia limnetica]PYE15923.1 acetyl esterase [Williamsia limnetica]